MSTGYFREWPPLLFAIRHVKRVRSITLARALSLEDAWRELQPALYEGRVKSRVPGRRYQIPRHDGIEPSDWYHANIFKDGSVEFVRQPALPLPPAGLGVPRYQIEVCWADMLRYWPELALTSDGAQLQPLMLDDLVPPAPLAPSAQGIQGRRAAPRGGVPHLPLPEFVVFYIRSERAAQQTPTKKGLEAAWRAAGRKGHREQLRAQFDSQMGDAAPKRDRLIKSRN